MSLRLELVGYRELMLSLQRFSDLIDDFGPLWDRYAVIMAEVEAEWFATAGHGSWPPLALSTLRQKARQGYPPDPLIRTGSLLRSLTDPAQAAGVSQGRSSLGTFTGKTFNWGSDDPTAEYHQDGRTHPNFMPSRPPIEWPLSPATAARFDEANREFVEEMLRESGLEA